MRRRGWVKPTCAHRFKVPAPQPMVDFMAVECSNGCGVVRNLLMVAHQDRGRSWQADRTLDMRPRTR